MRQIVRASLPLGDGIVLDPFMGGGSTIAAAVAVGYEGIGIESDSAFFELAVEGIPQLAALTVGTPARARKNKDIVPLNAKGKSQLGFFH